MKTINSKMSATQAVSDYLDYATFHGVRRTKNAPYKLFKVLWILALGGSLGMITWQVHTLYRKLNSYPINTSVEEKTEKSLRFPRIIFCNTNPASYYRIPYESHLEGVVQEASLKYSINLSIFNVTDLYLYDYSTYDMDTKDTNISLDILFSTSEQFKMQLAVKSLPQLKNISQTLEEFMLICNFAGQPCDEEAFTIKRSYDYGLCYEFDSAKQRGFKPHGNISAAGPRYSLEMLLNVDEYDSIPFVTTSTGVVVSAEATDTNFHPENGVFIPTGFETNIALTQIQQKRATGKTENKRCNDDALAGSLLDCRENCKQLHILNHCRCYQYFYKVGTTNYSISLNNIYDDKTGYRPCYTKEDYTCILASLQEFTTMAPDLCIECLPPCDEVLIKNDVSMVKWLGKNFIPILRRILMNKHKYPFKPFSLDREFVRDNMVLVRLYMPSMSYSVMKEEYAYSEVEFISDIGGQLGLWAGCSVLSLLEVVELCFLLCASSQRKKTRLDNPEAEGAVHPDKNA